MLTLPRGVFKYFFHHSLLGGYAYFVCAGWISIGGVYVAWFKLTINSNIIKKRVTPRNARISIGSGFFFFISVSVVPDSFNPLDGLM